MASRIEDHAAIGNCEKIAVVGGNGSIEQETRRRNRWCPSAAIIEPLSLDEAYLDVTENLQGIPLARDIALRIRGKIKDETHLNASAGISYNKFLAKLASDHRKPNGQYVISPEMGPAFVEMLPVAKFHGIGPATSAKMNALGIFTGLDMRNQTLEFMNANFGKAGAHYYWISRLLLARPADFWRLIGALRAGPTFCIHDRSMTDLICSSQLRPTAFSLHQDLYLFGPSS
jgi:DNA polymerase-4